MEVKFKLEDEVVFTRDNNLYSGKIIKLYEGLEVAVVKLTDSDKLFKVRFIDLIKLENVEAEEEIEEANEEVKEPTFTKSQIIEFTDNFLKKCMREKKIKLTDAISTRVIVEVILDNLEKDN